MKKHYLYTGIFYILLLAVCGKLFAEAIILEEIIVRGEKKVVPEESLDMRDIRKTAARDVGEALKVVEGVSFVRKGAIANDVVVRGFSRDNLNVLIDGMRIYGACPNRMDPAAFHIDFAEIKKISVLKGPFDVRNPGSLGGLIEINTTVPGEGFKGEINTFLGSYRNITTSTHTSYGDEKWDILVGHSYKYSLPYKDGNSTRITEQYPPFVPNRYKDSEKDDKAYLINTSWVKLGFNISDYQRLEVSYSRQEADDVIYPYLLMDAVYDDTDRVNISYERLNVCKLIEKIKAQFYFNQVKHVMTDERRVSSLGWVSGYMMKTYAETNTFGGKVESDLFVDTGTLSVGADYYFRNWDAINRLPTGIQKMMPDVDLSNFGVFVAYNRTVKKQFKLAAGARADKTRTKANDNRSDFCDLYYAAHDMTKTDFCSGGNIQLTYLPVTNIELFAGFGHASRPPDPEERYIALQKPLLKPDWVGNPELDPVQNREFDIGIKYLGNRIYGKAMFYYSDIKDFITVYNIAGQTKSAKSFQNVNATLYGGEVNVNVYLPFDLDFQGGLSYTWGKNDTSGNPLPEISPLMGRVAIKYDNEKYFIDLESVFADDQNRTDSDLNEEKSSGWAIINFTAGVKYKKFNVFAGLHNIFDKHYFEHLSYQRDPFRSGIIVPEIGRNIYLNITYKW